MDQQCPQCGRDSNISKHRMVQDSCGHIKCRVCLLEDDSECRSCIKQNTDTQHESRYSNESYASQIILESPQSIGDSDKESNTTNKISQVKLKTGWAMLNAQVNASCESVEVNNGTDTLLDCIDNTSLENPNNDETIECKEDTLVKDDESKVNGTRNQKRKRKQKMSDDVPAKRQRGQMILPKHIITKTIRKGSNIIDCFECLICAKTFRARGHSRYHIHCNSKFKPFHCNTCKKGFSSRSHFEYHKKSHLGQKSHSCNECGKAFLSVGLLNRHIKIHDVVKQYQCPDCDRSFSSESSLKAHSYQHSGLKLYKCEECSKLFSDPSNLKRHSLTHTGVKAYMCDQCGQSFALKWSLLVHSNSHSKERSHECHECHRTFTDQRGLSRHILTHSDDKPYNCNFCNTKSRRKDNLERHIRNTHPECLNNYEKVVSDSSPGTSPERTQPPIPNIFHYEDRTSIGGLRKKLSELERKLAKTERTNAENHKTVIVAERRGEFIEKSNTVNVIKSTNNCRENFEFEAGHSNAVPVINGPIKLSIKNMRHSAKASLNSYSNKDFSEGYSRKSFSQYPSDLQRSINDYQFIENPNNISDRVDIYKKILSPMPNSFLSQMKTSTPVTSKKHDQIERYKKILNSSYVSEAQTQTKLTNGPDNDINTKLEMQSTSSGSNNLLNSQVCSPISMEDHENGSKHLEVPKMKDNLTQDETIENEELNNHKHVSTITVNHGGRTDDFEVHWRRRTAQNYNFM